jgi:thiamine-phosphate pyrophosphorylase
MAGCYSACVPRRHPNLWPNVWLLTDARIDDRIEPALDRLPRGSGLVFRHYHLPPAARRARFHALAALANRRAHLAVLSGTAAQARRVGAAGVYGSARRLAGGPALFRLVTAHSLAEIGAANRMRADAIVLSPVFATRTHPGGKALGNVRFRLLATRSRVPVIALGGMTARRAKAVGAGRWAAIESLAQLARTPFPLHS